ncbi:MAG: hypothetical protein Q4C42_07590 [Clostridia bacterium]|nr:hypothetical protein [Clostridia bacterium]
MIGRKSNIGFTVMSLCYLAGIILHLFTRISQEYYDIIWVGVIQSTVPRCLYITGTIIWTMSHSQEIVHKTIRNCFIVTGGLMVFWLSVLHVKWTFIGEEYFLGRLLWYSYYIPLIFAPLMSFYASLCIASGISKKLSKWWFLFSVPAIILIVLVFTNELHFLVFKFDSKTFGINVPYTHEIVYYLILAYAILLIITMLILVNKTAFKTKEIKYVLYPMLPILSIVIYMLIYEYGNIRYFKVVFSLAPCLVFLYAFGWEILIQLGIVPTNRKHREMLRESTPAGRITDRNLVTQFRSKYASYARQEDMISAIENPVMLDKTTRYRSAEISGGYVFWEEDVSAFDEALSELKNIREKINEENELLRAEISLRKNRSLIETRTALIDYINAEFQDDIAEVDNIISTCDDNNLRISLFKSCLIGTFIKRGTNLYLLSQESDMVRAKELEYALKELSKTFSCFDVSTTLSISVQGFLPAEELILVLDCIMRIVSKSAETMSRVDIVAKASSQLVAIKLDLFGVHEIYPQKPESEKYELNTFFRDNPDSTTVEILCLKKQNI